MRPPSWLTGHVVPSAPRLLTREVVASAREARRRWWAAMPFGWKVLLWSALTWLLAPWLLWLTLWYWDRAFGAGAAVNWLAPKG